MSAERLEEGLAGSGGGDGDMRAVMPGQLHSKQANTSGGTVNENAVATLEGGFFKEGLPGGEGGDGDCGGVSVVEGCGLVCEHGRGCDDVFGLGTIGEPVIEAKDGVSDLKARDVCAEGCDDAGELVTENDGKRTRGSGCEVESGIPVELARGDGGGVNFDQHLSGLRRGIGQSAEDQSFSAGLAGEIGSFHDA